ncbi:MAG: transposase [Candidatus Omnitrophota bacterium]
MPSAGRTHQLSQSLLYHVFNRGQNRDKIFHDNEDYNYFIKLLSNCCKAKELKIYHWVIMSNHYHIVLELDEPKMISSAMAGIARSYVYYYHRKYKSAGHLWQGRFKSQPIQKELYLLGCGRYIERNPVKAGMVEKPGNIHTAAQNITHQTIKTN